ncbi:Tricalbin-2 [Friedmanniomyces endolithicus]|nr:Tricalbin-2 [Friedmanniomyces endolithicus]
MLEGTAGGASELKQQVALEAAADPNSSVTVGQAEDTLLAQSKAGGAAAFQLDPDATPEEKAAQLKAATQSIRPHRKHQVAALVTDQDDGETAGYDLPPPSKAGAIPITKDADGNVNKEELGEYSKVGWAPRFGNPWETEEQGSLLDHATFLEGQLDDKFFGEWFHNAAAIIFACLASWTIAALGGGLGWVFLVMAACGTYYRTSLRRVRRNFRDDVHRELAKDKLDTNTESLEWINSFLVKFWPIYAPVICQTVILSVDQVLSTTTPPFLDSLKMKFFTLGTKPPRMEHVKTYPKAEDDTVLMDWKFSFTPNDTEDMTAKQVKNKVNPKVVLEVRVGKAMLSTGLDIIVEDMACSGLMRVKMKLQLPFPHIDRVEICFLERPTFDYVCKPIGGDMLGFDMNFVPGLQGFIQEQIHANLAPMMYAPNVFPIEIAKMLAGNPVDQAIGVLQVTFHGAQGLKNPDKFSGTPDPYATLSINNREVLGKTKTVEGNASPRWNETVNIILTSLREPLTIHVWDYNEVRKDKDLGVCTFDLEQLAKVTEHENAQLEVIASGRPRGIVQADIRFFPVLEGHKLADGTVEAAPESSTGIVKFTVDQAKDLDGTKSLGAAINPYAVLLLNGKEVTTSKKLNHTNNPIWPDATKEMLITDRKSAKLGVVIKDSKDLAADVVLGTYQIKLDDLLELSTKGQEWYAMAGAKSGRAKLTLQWKPVALKGGMGGSGGYITPIGVMRFHFQSGRDLKNLDTMGKSDPYVRVCLSGIQKARTVTWKNNLNPDWDEIFYVPVHSTREKLVIEVMDEENTGKDRTMGQLEIAAAEYVKLGEDGQYLIHDSKNKILNGQVRMGAAPPKGTVNYTVAFYPCLNVADPEDEEREAAEKKQIAESAPKAPVDGKVPAHARSDTAGTINTLTSVKSATSGEMAMQKVLAAGEHEQTETDEVKEAVVPKIHIGLEDLTKYESGLLIFKILDGQLAHPGTYLEVVMDDSLFPAYSSGKAKSQHYNFNETGDTMIRELDLSRITLRLVSNLDKKGEDDLPIKAKVTGQTLDTLKHCLYKPQQITLRDTQGRESKITVSMRFLPVQMKLDPSESFNNAGNVRVEVVNATELPSADRNGYSDPYCKFVLNGKEVYKTKTQKKTLNPEWNEVFDIPVRSRTGAHFEVDVYDWDFGEKADFLGKAQIPLDALQPFENKQVQLPLDGKSGTVFLKMVFKPDYVVRSRQGSSTFSGTFSSAPGKVIGAPVKGVGKGAAFVGGGVTKGAGFLGNTFKRRTTSQQMIPQESAEVNGAAPDARDVSSGGMDSPSSPVGNAVANGHASQVSVDGYGGKDLPATPTHQRVRSSGGAALMGAGGGGGGGGAGSGEAGTASITVVSASGFEGDPKLEVHILHETAKGTKEVMKTEHVKAKAGAAAYEHASKSVACAADSTFHVQVKDHKTFGSDLLGEATFSIAEGAKGGQQEVRVGSSGVVVLRTGWQAADAVSVMGSTMGGAGGLLGASAANGESPASAGRKGLGRFMSSRNQRSVTPSSG